VTDKSISSGKDFASIPEELCSNPQVFWRCPQYRQENPGKNKSNHVKTASSQAIFYSWFTNNSRILGHI